MNNNTRIRLHLSKGLFENIAQEVLAEAKKPNDGYSVAVKQPKMPKQSKSQAASPEVQKTDAEATMGEAGPNIPMPSSKPKMPGVPSAKPENPAYKKPAMPGVPSAKPENPAYKKPAMPKLPGQANEMETRVAEKEDSVKEAVGGLDDPNFIAGVTALLGVGSAILVPYIKALKAAKSPEDKKKIRQSLSNAISKKMGGNMEEKKEEVSH